jgi:fumarate reductase subunit C
MPLGSLAALKTFQMQSSIQLIQPQILVVLNILKQPNANLYAHTWLNSLSKASSLQLADRTP